MAEVRAHLLDAVEAELSTGAEEGIAAQRAIVRFGLVAETARQFNCLAARRGAVLRRALVPWIAAVALSLMATATVWAFHAGPAPSQQAHAHPALRQRCVPRCQLRAGSCQREAGVMTDTNADEETSARPRVRRSKSVLPFQVGR